MAETIVKNVTDQNFKATVEGKETKVVLIDFHANWCGPCRALEPTIQELAKEFQGKVVIGRMDVDESPQTAEQFQIFSVPTLLVFEDGKEQERQVGLCPKRTIIELLQKHLQ